jgi:hypothetical protein
VLPIEKRRQYEEKAVYLNPHALLLHELLRYAVEHGLAQDDRYWLMTRQQGHTIVTRAAAASGVYRLTPEKRGGRLVEVRTPAWLDAQEHAASVARQAEEEARRRAEEERARRAWASKPPEERIAGRLQFWIQGRRVKGREPTEPEIAARRAELLAELRRAEPGSARAGSASPRSGSRP